jgi:hypothetical protein
LRTYRCAAIVRACPPPIFRAANGPFVPIVY